MVSRIVWFRHDNGLGVAYTVEFDRSDTYQSTYSMHATGPFLSWNTPLQNARTRSRGLPLASFEPHTLVLVITRWRLFLLTILSASLRSSLSLAPRRTSLLGPSTPVHSLRKRRSESSPWGPAGRGLENASYTRDTLLPLKTEPIKLTCTSRNVMPGRPPLAVHPVFPYRCVFPTLILTQPPLGNRLVSVTAHLFPLYFSLRTTGRLPLNTLPF